MKSSLLAVICGALLVTLVGCAADADAPTALDDGEAVGQTAEALTNGGLTPSPGGGEYDPCPGGVMRQVEVCTKDPPCGRRLCLLGTFCRYEWRCSPH